MTDTQRSGNVSTKQRRIADIARQRAPERLTALNHDLDVEWLTEAFHRVRRDGAPGVDGQTVADYGQHLGCVQGSGPALAEPTQSVGASMPPLP